MTLLLDTHVLLWWLDDPSRLSDAARSAIRRPSNLVYISAATVWEIEIKRASGKLEAPEDLGRVLTQNRFFELPITTRHAQVAASLPDFHRDPFDRMLIAQARIIRAYLATRDAQIERYDVLRLRA